MEFYRERKKINSFPIIPLIDILAILLLFFAATTQFKNEHFLLKVDLPEIKNIKLEKSRGEYSLIILNPSGDITLDGIKIERAYLENSLINFRKKYPNRNLRLEADKNASIENLFSLWDAFVAAGFQIGEIPTHVQVSSAK